MPEKKGQKKSEPSVALGVSLSFGLRTLSHVVDTCEVLLRDGSCSVCIQCTFLIGEAWHNEQIGVGNEMTRKQFGRCSRKNEGV
jgi:hypothetical protein